MTDLSSIAQALCLIGAVYIGYLLGRGENGKPGAVPTGLEELSLPQQQKGLGCGQPTVSDRSPSTPPPKPTAK